MRELGVRRSIGPTASGALTADLQLGEFVVCDQFLNLTSGREDTFYDGAGDHTRLGGGSELRGSAPALCRDGA